MDVHSIEPIQTQIQRNTNQYKHIHILNIKKQFKFCYYWSIFKTIEVFSKLVPPHLVYYNWNFESALHFQFITVFEFPWWSMYIGRDANHTALNKHKFKEIQVEYSSMSYCWCYVTQCSASCNEKVNSPTEEQLDDVIALCNVTQHSVQL